jgi:hypothetical protein
MIKKSQLHELVKHLVQTVITELGAMDLASSTAISQGSTPTSDPAQLSPAAQQKIEREKKLAASNKVKIDQKMLKKVNNDIKSQKSTYDLTRRYTAPNLKKQIDAEKQALRTL